MSAPAVAVSRDGKRIAAAWMDEREKKGERRVYWSIGDSIRFVEDSPVEPGPAHLQDHPAVAIDEAGTAWTAWEDDDRSGRRTIRVRSSAKGSKAEPASEAPEGKAAFPALAAAGGIVGLVYETGQRGEEMVVFRRLR